ncbi:XRE family transcriptional regulator [Kitasatospora viridis]|uniref:Helix-turn-helix protein n=1 Tax=Kitasatospora viridis TaxID=281105 RepID=A0A561UKR4_9ACTN|nr:XRE family transcriptional regulator [Kitasatospora viridis]TWF99958.1 hypothetical protein FHX73_113818 [Kitasatospora viridis]
MRYTLRNPDLLRMLMQHTGTGRSVSIRDLARTARCSHGTIHNLLAGSLPAIEHPAAVAIAHRIGVDLLVLWAPVGRAAPLTSREAVPV